MNSDNAILSVSNLSVNYSAADGAVKAVENVSFKIKPGSTFALVGRSGCGKTTIALAILRLLNGQGKITGGNIIFDGVDLLSLAEKEMRKIRGAQISMIFQQPAASFNPVFTVGSQIAETIMLHQGKNKKDALADSVDLLKKVDIDQPEKIIRRYPHQLSGGILQRVMIAIALCCRPKLLIADEPTSSLDVATEAGILDLLFRLQKDENISVLLITHNPGIVADRADYVAVMNKGSIVEQGETESILKNPSNSYTQSLINNVAGKINL